MTNYNDIIQRSVKLIEKFLASTVLVLVIIYISNSFIFFTNVDWQEKEMFYELIYRVLLITIGLELARMLVTHNFLSILELLAFVVARKMLKPDLTSMDVFLGVVSFSVLLMANRFLINPIDQKINSNNSKHA